MASAIKRIGLTCVAEPRPGVEPAVNVIFVHGLNGHPQATWSYDDEGNDEDNEEEEVDEEDDDDRPSHCELESSSKSPKRFPIRGIFKSLSKSRKGKIAGRAGGTGSPSPAGLSKKAAKKSFWPAEYLPQKVPSARVFTYGYNSVVASVLGQKVSENTITQHGNDFMLVLERELRVLGNKDRIIFVAHSLGGIVVKRAVAVMWRKPDPDRRFKECVERVAGIVFCGTPHRGSSAASWGTVVTNLIRTKLIPPSTVLHDLRRNPGVLEDINEEFVELPWLEKIWIHSFREDLPMNLIGTKIVSNYSAILGLPNERAESIAGDHRTMVRKEGMQQITAVVRGFASDLRPAVPQLKEELLQACLQTLSFPEMNDRVKTVVTPTKGTCQWILDDEEYKAWLGDRAGLLWIRGKAGAGKSTLLKHALANFIATSSGPGSGDQASDQIILSFFCHKRGKEPLQKSAVGVYRSLLHQVLNRFGRTDCFRAEAAKVVEFFERQENVMGKHGKAWHWNVEDVKQLLRSSLVSILHGHSVTLFIDALDECGELEAVELVRHFKSLAVDLDNPSRSHRFRLCFSCRSYPVISISFGSVVCPEQHNGADIRKFIEAELSEVGDDALAEQ